MTTSILNGYFESYVVKAYSFNFALSDQGYRASAGQMLL